MGRGDLHPVLDVMAPAALLLFSIVTLGAHAYGWATTGVWPEVPLSAVFSYFGIDLSSPGGWAAWFLEIRLHWVALVIGGLVIIGVLAGFLLETYSRVARNRKVLDYGDVESYQRKAEDGIPWAQNNLAFLYEKGLGVPQDYVQAHMWYNIAAATHPPGPLRSESALNRDKMARHMTPNQIAEAQNRAREWLERRRAGSQPCQKPPPKMTMCPVIAAYVQEIETHLPDEWRQKLASYTPRLARSHSPPHERARAEYLAWQAIRVFAPLALAVAGRDEAKRLSDFTGTLGEVADSLREIAAALHVVEVDADAVTNVAYTSVGAAVLAASDALSASPVVAARTAARAVRCVLATFATRINRDTDAVEAAGAALKHVGNAADVDADAALAALKAFGAVAQPAAEIVLATDTVYQSILDTLNGVLAIGEQADELLLTEDTHIR